MLYLSSEFRQHRKKGSSLAQKLHQVAERLKVAVLKSKGGCCDCEVLYNVAEDSRLRVGIWFGPDPDPSLPVEKINFTGTVADREAILDFMAHFDPCGSRQAEAE